MKKILNEILDEIVNEKSASCNPNNLTKRGGDYRIGLTKAHDIVHAKLSELQTTDKSQDKGAGEALHIADVIKGEAEQLFCSGCGHKKQHNIYTDANTALVCKNPLCKQNICL